MTGWNLPPGCEVHHIPGNRPEDELAEAVAEGWRPRCVNCGGYLKLGIQSREETADGSWEGNTILIEYRTCAKCGRETIDQSYLLEGRPQ